MIRECQDCNGSGMDRKKTEKARQAGQLDDRAYIRCWSCNGNGLEPPYPDYSKHFDHAIDMDHFLHPIK